MTRDRSNPIMRMTPVTADRWLQKTCLTNEYRKLREWARILYLKTSELQAWLDKYPRDWEIKTK